MTTRRRLPNRRDSNILKLAIVDDAGVRHKLFLGVSLFPDGTPAEVWIDSSKDGTTLRGFMGDFSRAVSIAFQHGAPLETLAHAFRGIEYPPNGRVEGHATIRTATSVPDLVFQVLEAQERGRRALAAV